MPASVGLLMPSALVLGSLIWGDDRLMQATCLVPYIGTLLSQIWMEGHFTKKGRCPLIAPLSSSMSTSAVPASRKQGISLRHGNSCAAMDTLKASS